MNIPIRDARQALLTAVANSCGLLAYRKTIDDLRKGDITSPIFLNYRKNYTAYYRVRRDEDWLNHYYAYLETNKNRKDITYEEVLRAISSYPHRTPRGLEKTVEASFASKLLHTINPHHPIWDSQVLKAVGIHLDLSLSFEAHQRECIRLYSELEQTVETYLQSGVGRTCIEEFDRFFPDYKNLSDEKKLDFYLWKAE